MKKTKSHSAPKAALATEDRDEALADRMVELARELRETDAYAVLSDALRKAHAELRKCIRKCLQQQREQALEEALERTYEEDGKAHQVLRENVEELSGTVVFHREDSANLEVNAFVIPFFVRTTGGLRSEQSFQDEEAFEQLRNSFKDGGLESRKASVVLVSHAYHAEEIEQIGYCQLSAMVHEASDAMMRKKAAAADAITRSMRGWPPSHFAPDDQAVELRFLLGFALKTMDDAFYQVPEKEAAADRYFEARAERFRKWSQDVTPLLQRCLVTDGRDVQIDFLYQDLFHGGREAGLAEMEMLELLSEIQGILAVNGIGPEDAKAIIGPMDMTDEAVLRVSLHARSTDTLLDVVDGPLNQTVSNESAIADIAESLMTIGIHDVHIARKFDSEGVPAVVRPYLPQ